MKQMCFTKKKYFIKPIFLIVWMNILKSFIWNDKMRDLIIDFFIHKYSPQSKGTVQEKWSSV